MKAVYRIVNGLLAVAIFPAIYLLDMFIVRLGTAEKLAGIIETLSDSGAQSVAIEETFSIKRIVDIFTGKDPLAALFNLDEKVGGPILWPKELYGLNTRLVIFAICFVLIVVATLFIIVWTCCSNKHLPIFIASLVGLVSVLVLMGVFNSMSASIYYGDVDLIDYFINQIIDSSIITSLLGFAASSAVHILITFGGAQNAVLFLFIALVCWTVIFFLVDLGDPKAKAEKEEEKAKALAKKQAKAKKKAEKKAVKANAQA